MATTPQDIINIINQRIVTNGNNEITALVLNPILVAMVQQYIDYIGDLNSLNTTDKSNIVNAINEIVTGFVGINSVIGGINISIDNTDPANPIINLDSLGTNGVLNNSNVPGVSLTDSLNELFNIYVSQNNRLKNVVAPLGATLDLDFDLYEGWNAVLTEDLTLSISNGKFKVVTVTLTGDFAITYPANSTVVGDAYDGTMNNKLVIEWVSATNILITVTNY